MISCALVFALSITGREASAQDDDTDWARETIDQAIKVQGGKETIEGVKDIYIRVMVKAYKQGSGGKTISYEGRLRQFYRPGNLLRIEQEDDLKEEAVLAKVYDSTTGEALWARHGSGIPAAKKEVKSFVLSTPSGRRKVEELQEHLRTMRCLFLDYFLQEGAIMEYDNSRAKVNTRKIKWRSRKDADEKLTLLFMDLWLRKVLIEPEVGGEEIMVSLEDHREHGTEKILLPRKATLKSRPPGGKWEPLMELKILPGGVVINPTLPARTYEDPSTVTPWIIE